MFVVKHSRALCSYKTCQFGLGFLAQVINPVSVLTRLLSFTHKLYFGCLKDGNL